MVLTIKGRFGIYRRYDKDIWGMSFSDFRRTNKVNRYFYNSYINNQEWRLNKTRRYVYRIDLINPRSFKRQFKMRFLSLRLLKLFFLTLKYRHFREMGYEAASKDGLFEENYCSLLEGRLVSLLYRSNLLFNMFEIIAYVKRCNVMINNILINYVNFTAGIGDFLSFLAEKGERFKNNMYKRFKTQTVLFNTPRYLYVNYKLFFAFMEKAPKLVDLVYPIKLDLYRATAFY